MSPHQQAMILVEKLALDLIPRINSTPMHEDAKEVGIMVAQMLASALRQHMELIDRANGATKVH